MFIKFNDIIVNSEYIIMLGMHELQDSEKPENTDNRYAIFIAVNTGSTGSKIAEHFSTEQDRNKRFYQLTKQLNLQ